MDKQLLYFINDWAIKKQNNNDNKYYSLSRQNEEYKNKINELEKNIKELEIKLIEKDKLITENHEKAIIIDNKDNINNSLLLKQNEEFKNRIKELEKNIKDLEMKLIEKDKLITEKNYNNGKDKIFDNNDNINHSLLLKQNEDKSKLNKLEKNMKELEKELILKGQLIKEKNKRIEELENISINKINKNYLEIITNYLIMKN